MAIAFDASTPALVSGATASVTSGSFTPPAGALLIVMVASNTPNGGDGRYTTVTNTGAAVTWTRGPSKTRNASSTGGTSTSNGGSAEIWTGVAAGGAMTVTSTNGQSTVGSCEKSMFIQVLTGADSTALTNFIAASSTSGVPSVNLTTLAGSICFASSSDWAQKGLGTAGTNQTILAEYNPSGLVTNHHWRNTAVTTAGTTTINLTAPGLEDFNVVAMEVRAAATVTRQQQPKVQNFAAIRAATR